MGQGEYGIDGRRLRSRLNSADINTVISGRRLDADDPKPFQSRVELTRSVLNDHPPSRQAQPIRQGKTPDSRGVVVVLRRTSARSENYEDYATFGGVLTSHVPNLPLLPPRMLNLNFIITKTTAKVVVYC